MRAGSKAKCGWHITGLRARVVEIEANDDLELIDAEVGELKITRAKPAPKPKPKSVTMKKRGGIVGDGVLQVIWMVMAAGATRLFGIG